MNKRGTIPVDVAAQNFRSPSPCRSPSEPCAPSLPPGRLGGEAERKTPNSQYSLAVDRNPLKSLDSKPTKSKQIQKKSKEIQAQTKSIQGNPGQSKRIQPRGSGGAWQASRPRRRLVVWRRGNRGLIGGAWACCERRAELIGYWSRRCLASSRGRTPMTLRECEALGHCG